MAQKAHTTRGGERQTQTGTVLNREVCGWAFFLVISFDVVFLPLLLPTTALFVCVKSCLCLCFFGDLSLGITRVHYTARFCLSNTELWLIYVSCS
ncbi:hypothetical protein QBC40DRAFT_22115 [Triangularia verruculosa]|uniref:Uncharacterized protein n=1 Tax=Triangularia verruculosa TaxID=2587418 RepID=A0AAN7AQ74_9PEZI|nr:hypothetical protein QBC40DRAFT_22115 [Triangularia verruculosa]